MRRVTAAAATQAQVSSWDTSDEDFIAYVRTFDAAGTLADGQFTLAVVPNQPEYVPPTPLPLGEQAAMSYAWVDVGSGTPSVTYSHNRAGGAITVETLGLGEYAVEFEGVQRGQTDLGHVQVSSYGGDDSVCVVDSWVSGERADDARILIDCFDASTGLAEHSQFNVSLAHPDSTADVAYAWVTLGGGEEVTYNNADSYVDNPTGDVIVNRTAAGVYRVRFEGQGGNPGGHVQVSSYGRAQNAAVTSWWDSGDDLMVEVLPPRS